MTNTDPWDRAPRASMFEAALEAMPDIVLIHDEELILFANAACRRFLEADCPEALEGRPIDVIIHPDAYAAGRERRRLLLEGGGLLRDIPLKLVTLGGRAKHVTVDALPLLFGEFKAGMVVAQDSAVD